MKSHLIFNYFVSWRCETINELGSRVNLGVGLRY